MEFFSNILTWLTANETLLSSGAAIVVMGGVVFTTLGIGLRAARNRRQADRAEGKNNGAHEISKPDADPDLPNRFSVAVLPFDNLSDDPEQEYLADGLTEDLITGLSLDTRLFVIARSSTAGYKGSTADIRQVGRELAARYVVEGSVRRRGDDLRISAQLIDAASGKNIWSDKLDHPFTEFFQAQDDLTNRIVVALYAELNIAEKTRLKQAPPDSLAAWELCVRAETEFMHRMSLDNITEGLALVRKALEIDPDYTRAWGLLGFFHAARVVRLPSTDVEADIAAALEATAKATALEPTDPTIMEYRGMALFYAGKMTESLAQLRLALQRNPNAALARLYLGAVSGFLGEPDTALVELNEFLRLNPRDPMAYLANYARALAYTMQGDLHHAEAAIRRSIDENADFSTAWLLLARVLFLQDRKSEVPSTIAEVKRLDPAITPSASLARTRRMFSSPAYIKESERFYDYLCSEGIWTD